MSIFNKNKSKFLMQFVLRTTKEYGRKEKKIRGK